MDYEQDYSKLTANDQQWYNGDISESAHSETSVHTAIAVENGNLVKSFNLDNLDNEDFE
jgi:O-glycosyl hydrolase